jgi:Tol biopolymer transport system component
LFNKHTSVDDVYQLYRCDMDGSNLTPVAHSLNGFGDIAVSPDGSRISFQTRLGQSNDLSLLVYNLGGVESAIYTSNLEWSYTWSNSGKRLAFAIDGLDGSGQEGGVYIADANGLNRTKIKAPFPISDDTPVWSPDDSQIVVTMYDDSGWNLYLVDVKTQALKKLTDFNLPMRMSPVWSPSGDKIMFRRGTRIDTISPDGTGLNTLVDTEDSAPVDAWSPDGRYIVYEQRPDNINMPIASLYIINADGGTPILLAGFLPGDGIDDISWVK